MSRGRIGLAGVLTLAGVGLAGLILARAPAQHAAAAARADSVAEHRVEEALSDLRRGAAWTQVAASARRTLDEAPMEASALSLLAMTLPEARRRPLMEAAARLSRRDDEADRWLFEDGMQRGDYARALRHADALMRRQSPDERVAVVRRIFPYLGQSAAFDALVARLALKPDWRATFLAQYIALSDDPGEAFPLLKALRGTSAPPTRPELAQYLRRLVADRRFGQARADWVALAPAEERAGRGLLADGDFSGVKPTAPFGWNLDSKTAGYGEMLPSGRDDGAALRVSHDGRSRQWLVRQLIVLAPGAYRLTGQVRTPTDLAAGSMEWTVVCEGSGKSLAAAPAPATGDGWAEFFLDFTVPAEGCQAQSLVLQSKPGDSGTPVEVWYDDFSIARIAHNGG